MQLLRTENEVLQQQVQKNSGTKQLGPKEESKYSDSSGILVLNKKLQDAQKIYEKVKSELSRVKQVFHLIFRINIKQLPVVVRYRFLQIIFKI